MPRRSQRILGLRHRHQERLPSLQLPLKLLVGVSIIIVSDVTTAARMHQLLQFMTVLRLDNPLHQVLFQTALSVSTILRGARIYE